MGKYLPGVGFIFLISAAIHLAYAELAITPAFPINKILMGLLLGIIWCQFFKIHTSLKPGIEFCFNQLLKIAVVLIGLKISIINILKTGSQTIFIILICIALALALSFLLAKWLKVSPKLATLIGVGTAICGNTAIAALAPTIRAKDEETAFAITLNTLIGTIAVFTYPIVGYWLGLDELAYGQWTGIAVNDTSQVVAAGYNRGQLAGEMAVTTKLIRNSLMGFVIIGAAYFFRTNENSKTTRKKSLIPLFIVVFIFLAILNSLGLSNWINTHVYSQFTHSLSALIKFLMLMALLAVGLNTSFGAIKKIGIKPVILGFTIAITTAVVGILLLLKFT